MIVAVITALVTLFYIAGWLILSGYVAWAASGSDGFAKTLMSSGIILALIGVGLTIRVIAALLA